MRARASPHRQAADCADLGVDALDARERRLEQLARRHLAAPHQLGEAVS